MPTITVSKQDLYRLAGLDAAVGLAELEERLALVKGELGSRTGDGRDLRDADQQWIDSNEDLALRIELADTNRPDLWCVEGIARQLRDHARGGGRSYDFYTRAPAEHTITVDARLEAIRPYVAGFLATGQTMDEGQLLAFIEAQETLTRNFGRRRQTVSIGVYDGRELAFPLRYRAVARDGSEGGRFAPLRPPPEELAPGQQWPEDVAMTPAEILQRHPTGRTYAAILAGMDRVPLLVDGRDAVLALPPIINSARLGRVTPGMDALFVEATGADLDQVLLAVNILAANLADRGWRITPVTSDYPYDTARGRRVTAPHDLSMTQEVALETFARLLGETPDAAEVAAQLQAYGVAATADGETITATIAGYRQDYLHPVDVVEDYAISRGYATFAPLLPEDFTVGRLDPLTEFEDLLRDLMIGFGFEEAVCNILTSGAKLREAMNVGETAAAAVAPFHGGRYVRIANVMNRNYAALRDWVLPSLLEVESHSAGALYPHRIFEVGEVAVRDEAHNLGARTESRLAGLIAAEEANFDTAQSVIYALLNSLDLPFDVVGWEHPSFIAGRVGLLRSGGLALGFVGELAPQVLDTWGARVPVAAFELALPALLNARARKAASEGGA